MLVPRILCILVPLQFLYTSIAGGQTPSQRTDALPPNVSTAAAETVRQEEMPGYAAVLTCTPLVSQSPIIHVDIDCIAKVYPLPAANDRDKPGNEANAVLT